MADISITASAVLGASDASTATGIAGATVTAGQPVYIDSSDSSELKPADADAETTAAAVGIALHGASDGQPLKYLTSGVLTLNSVATAGTTYVVSATAGGIAPDADLSTGKYKTIVGIGTAATTIKVQFNASGVAIP